MLKIKAVNPKRQIGIGKASYGNKRGVKVTVKNN